MRLHGLSTRDTDVNVTVVLADIFTLKRDDKALEEIVAIVSLDAAVKAVSWEMARAP